MRLLNKVSVMSDPYLEAQASFYEDYELWCAENKLQATFDGFGVWLSDGDFDSPEVV